MKYYWKTEIGKDKSRRESGRRGRIRTCDPFVPNEVRYQAAPHADQRPVLYALAAVLLPLPRAGIQKFCRGLSGSVASRSLTLAVVNPVEWAYNSGVDAALPCKALRLACVRTSEPPAL